MPESPQGIYAPLPQSLTDSESEEELHNSKASNETARRLNLGNSGRGNHHKLINDGAIIGESTEIIINHNNHYHNATDDDNGYGMFSELTDDNVAILQESEKKEPMSFLRKCCFFLSLQMCFLTVFVFIWVLPCSDELSCPAAREQMKTHKWMREYEDIELKGMINVVDGNRGRSKNLVFMYRIDKILKIPNVTWPRKNGIICLVGGLGQVAWFDEMVNEPSAIDCNLIDANKDGSLDCIVTDEYSQIGCINPVTGQWLWHNSLKEKNITKKNDLLDFPLVLPDLNGDSVNEILLVSSLGGSSHNNLVIISGANGEKYVEHFTDTECWYIHKLQIDQISGVTYNCMTVDSNYEKTKLFSALAPQLSLKINTTKRVMPQHKFFGQRRNTKNQRNLYSVSGKQLTIENRGLCPNSCNLLITLTDKKNLNETIILNGTAMYGMVPTQLSFNKSNIDSKSVVHGFVIKFWEFNQNDSTPMKTAKNKRDMGGEFNVFSKNLKRQRRWVMPINREDREVHLENYTRTFFRSKMHLIKETILLIIFNSTNTRIVNTSQSNILQLCRRKENGVNDTEFCQPDLNYQENSLLVADLDKDGSQELVSYYTTYVNTEEADRPWKLLTYVQLLRLESELPQLYESSEIKN